MSLKEEPHIPLLEQGSDRAEPILSEYGLQVIPSPDKDFIMELNSGSLKALFGEQDEAMKKNLKELCAYARRPMIADTFGNDHIARREAQKKFKQLIDGELREKETEDVIQKLDEWCTLWSNENPLKLNVIDSTLRAVKTIGEQAKKFEEPQFAGFAENASQRMENFPAQIFTFEEKLRFLERIHASCVENSAENPSLKLSLLDEPNAREIFEERFPSSQASHIDNFLKNHITGFSWFMMLAGLPKEQKVSFLKHEAEIRKEKMKARELEEEEEVDPLIEGYDAYVESEEEEFLDEAIFFGLKKGKTQSILPLYRFFSQDRKMSTVQVVRDLSINILRDFESHFV